MNKTLLLVLGVLLIIFIVALTIFAFLGVYILVKKNPDLFKSSAKDLANINEDKDSTLETEANSLNMVPEVLEEHCSRHPDTRARALCAICMEAYCEKCIITESEANLNFCTDHYRLYANNNWEALEKIRTNPEEAHQSEYLYHFKNNKWQQTKQPMIVTTHYQINVDKDMIESEVTLLAKEDDHEQLQQQLKEIKEKLQKH